MGHIFLGSIERVVVAASCSPSDAVGNLVYVTGPSVGGVVPVSTIDPTDLTKLPCIGMILEKTSTTTCSIALQGLVEVGGPYIPQKVYFASAAGVPTATISSTRPFFLQAIGQALDATRLVFRPSVILTRLSP